MKDLDLYTLETIKHLFAGRLSNIRGGSENIINSKLTTLDGTKWAEIINRDAKYITDKLINLIEENK